MYYIQIGKARYYFGSFDDAKQTAEEIEMETGQLTNVELIALA